MRRCARCGRTWIGPREGWINGKDYCHSDWSSAASCYMRESWAASSVVLDGVPSLNEVLQSMIDELRTEGR